MDLIRLGLLVILILMMISYFKQENKNWAFCLKLGAGIFLGFLVVEKFLVVQESCQEIFLYLKEYSVYISLFLKALGISYICEFVSNLAKEEGQSNLGNQVELLGKLSVFSLGIPVILTLFSYLEEFF